MARQKNMSTIAAIMLGDGPPMAIDTLADEILQSNVAKNANARTVSWDCDDLVFLDFDGLRIALYEIERTQDCPPFICLGVGSVPGNAAASNMACGKITEELVQRLTQIVPANAVLWHDDRRALGSDVMDDFHDGLGNMLEHLNSEIMHAQDAHGTPAAQTEMTRADTLQNDALLNKLRGYLRETGQSTYAKNAALAKPLQMISGTGFTLLFKTWLRSGLDKWTSPS